MSLDHCLAVSIIIFFIGALGMIIRRNLIIMFMCLELMLNAINLALVTFGRAHNHLDGQIFVFFIIVVAACEAAVGLAILITAFRHMQSVNSAKYNQLKG